MSHFALQGLELKTVVNFFASKSESILLRYLTFYNNLAEMIIDESKQGGDSNNNSSCLHDPKPQRQGALYFEFFDQVRETPTVVALTRHVYFLGQANLGQATTSSTPRIQYDKQSNETPLPGHGTNPSDSNNS